MSKNKSLNYDLEEKIISTEIPSMSVSDIDEKTIELLDKLVVRDKHIKEIEEKFISLKLKKTILNQLSTDIEKSIFDFSLVYSTIEKFSHPLFEAVYRDKLDELLNELNKEHVRNNVVNKILHSKYLAFYSPQQLDPLVWKDITDKQKIIEEKKDVQFYTDLYKCFKCNQRKTVVRQAQTRSADEPMTNFITCVACKNTWTS
jgi:DNA-directed RNA polymerase subunit M/transcription elongation factor TFIIS